MKIKKVLIKDMAGLEKGSPVYLKSKEDVEILVKKGFVAKEEKRGRKTKEEK